MPIYKPVPDGQIKWAKGDTTQQAANSDSAVSVTLTVPSGRRFTVFQVITDQTSASIDVLCKHVGGGSSQVIVDRNASTLPTDEKSVFIQEVCAAGDQFLAGIRNRTGAGVTPVMIVGYVDAGA